METKFYGLWDVYNVAKDSVAPKKVKKKRLVANW